MNKFRFTIKMLAIAIFMLAFASLTQAQATRTWVSGVGDDANPCSRTAPCKTFAGAISKTAVNGEINCVDNGGFGAVTITKGITIDGTSTLAGILNAGTNGVIVNAPAGDKVTLRGLDINGAGTGVDGIRLLQADKLAIEDCVIYGSTNGINIAETGGSTRVNIRNTVVRNNSADGLVVSTNNPGLIFVTIERSSFIGNAVNGLHAKQNSRVNAYESSFSNNVGIGVFVEGIGGIALADLSSSFISNNGGNGIQAGGGGANTSSIARINNNDILQNATGALVSTNGEIDTWANNRFNGNTSNTCTSCTDVTGTIH